MKQFTPAAAQASLPQSQLILNESPGEEAIPMDVLFVGAGPAGLSGAIALSQLVQADPDLKDIEIGVLEKASQLGGHCLSGAVLNPTVLKELFPNRKDLPLRQAVQGDEVYFLTEKGKVHIPTPPTMHNKGHYVASICEVVRWMGERAEEMGVHILTGFPAASLLTKGHQVKGVRTTPLGLKRDGTPSPRHEPPTDLSAQVTVLTEGTRGSLSPRPT